MLYFWLTHTLTQRDRASLSISTDILSEWAGWCLTANMFEERAFLFLEIRWQLLRSSPVTENYLGLLQAMQITTPKNLLEQRLCMYACTQMCVCVCTHVLVTSCVGACVLACTSLCVRVCGSLTSAFEFCLSSPLGTGFYLNFQALWMKLQWRKLESLWLTRCRSTVLAKLSDWWLIWSKIEYRMFAWNSPEPHQVYAETQVCWSVMCEVIGWVRQRVIECFCSVTTAMQKLEFS